MASECRAMFRWLINVMHGGQDIIEVEVPRAYFTTQGVPPHRDVVKIIFRGSKAVSIFSVSKYASKSVHLYL
jgi:hypothetical protein